MAASPPDTEGRWESWFQPGETLLWHGTPKPGVHGLAKIIGLAIFGLPFFGAGLGMLGAGLVMVFTDSSLGGIGMGLFMTAFSLPFTAIGGAMVLGQWYAAHQAHRKVRYALTNRAAYIAQSWWKRSLDAYPILRSTPVGLEKGRTADTVWFHVHSEKDSDGDRTTTRKAFDNIAHGETVFKLIRSIQTGMP
jgi:hypothetical protein